MDADDQAGGRMTASRGDEQRSKCDGGEPCMATTTGCAAGQCHRRNMKFHPDGSITVFFPVAINAAPQSDGGEVGLLRQPKPAEGATLRTDEDVFVVTVDGVKMEVVDAARHRQLERELAEAKTLQLAWESQAKGAEAALSATTQHWVYAAAEAHRPLVLKMMKWGGHGGRDHLLHMLREIAKSGMSPTKACRWLGWIQGSLYAEAIATLDELKAINLAASRAADRTTKAT